jgi:hypothetical protein
VDAAGDGDVDQAVLASEGHRWFGSLHGERIEPFSPASTQDKTKYAGHTSIVSNG